MLSGSYARIEPANSSLSGIAPEAGAAPEVGPLGRSLGHNAELALALATVLLASSGVWALGSWLLTTWQLN